MNKNKLIHYFVIFTFISLYLIVSLISTIHVIDFFSLTNPRWLAISLAVAFEVGAAASLSALIVLQKVQKGLVWFLFILLTAMQAMGNSFYAYMHVQNFQGWIELFGLVDMELIEQKRILSVISGAILPIVALGFIKSLVDYMKPDEDKTQEDNSQKIESYEKEIDELHEKISESESVKDEHNRDQMDSDIENYKKQILELERKLEYEKNKSSFEKSLDETKELITEAPKPSENTLKVEPRKIIYTKTQK